MLAPQDAAKRILGILLVGLLIPQAAHAQNITSGIATRIPLAESDDTFDGAVICSEGGIFHMCKSAYAPSMFGIVTDNPGAYFESSGEQEGRLVTSTGTVVVRANNNLNGEIAEGDFVTSSETPGTLMKATENGYVLGVALHALTNTDEEGTGPLVVAINIHPEASLSSTRTNLIAVLRKGTTAPIFEPLDSLRYLLAAALIVISFTLGFVYFGRVARSGVEAIGRNPLAGKMIQMSIVLHVIVSIAIVLAGLFTAYLILII